MPIAAKQVSKPFCKEHGADTLFIMGLATDYCVRYSVRDARAIGYDIYVIEDGCRGIELQEGDIAAALREMASLGAEVITSSKLP